MVEHCDETPWQSRIMKQCDEPPSPSRMAEHCDETPSRSRMVGQCDEPPSPSRMAKRCDETPWQSRMVEHRYEVEQMMHQPRSGDMQKPGTAVPGSESGKKPSPARDGTESRNPSLRRPASDLGTRRGCPSDFVETRGRGFSGTKREMLFSGSPPLQAVSQ
jgi:hypothetical protein